MTGELFASRHGAPVATALITDYPGFFRMDPNYSTSGSDASRQTHSGLLPEFRILMGDEQVVIEGGLSRGEH